MLIFLLSIFALSHYTLQTSYFGYLMGIVVVLLSRLKSPSYFTQISRPNSAHLIGGLVFAAATIRSVQYSWIITDIFRDIGVLLAFIIGRKFVLPKNHKPLIIQSLKKLTKLGNIVVVLVLIAAGLAYKDGASAYYWRGSYIPYIHNWLPFFLVVNVGMLRLHPKENRYIFQGIICVLGTLASLSRTDLMLEGIFGILLVITNWRRVLTFRGIALLILSLSTITIMIAFSKNFDVVQEHLGRGVDFETDESLGWRLIEARALFSYFGVDWLNWLFGAGIGARVPLPPGILDFNGNNSIPFLHNSYLTIILKIGIFGLFFFALYVANMLHQSSKSKSIESRFLYFVGAWFVVFVLGKAMTLQGLSEWGHVFFFGLGICLIMAANKAHLNR